MGAFFQAACHSHCYSNGVGRHLVKASLLKDRLPSCSRVLGRKEVSFQNKHSPGTRHDLGALYIAHLTQLPYNEVMVIQFDFTDEERFICIKIIKPQRPCSFCVCVCAHQCIQAYMSTKQVCSSRIFFFRQDLSRNLEAHKLARLSSQKALGIHLLCSRPTGK